MRKFIQFTGLSAFCFFVFCAVGTFIRQHDFVKERAAFDARKTYLLEVIEASNLASSFANKQNKEFRLIDRESLDGEMNTELWGGKVLVLKNGNYTDAIVKQDYQSIFSSHSSRLHEMRNLGFKVILFSNGREEWKYTL
jgi:hypothetical protein